MDINHIYVFSNHNKNSISSRYRAIYVLEELYQNHKIEGTFIYPGYRPKEILRFILAYCHVLFTYKKGTVVIYQKLYSKGIYTSLLKLLIHLRPNGSVYDTDDADYIRYDDQNINYFIRKCRLCTVGSQALKTYARKYNQNVFLLGSPVIQHHLVKEKKNSTLHIGWIGDLGWNIGKIAPFSHKLSLFKLYFPILKDLNFDVKLTILGVKNPRDKKEIENYFKNNSNITLNIPMEVNWLDELSIYKKVREFDVGISPLVDHEFNVAKSAFKVKQYFSCGVPALASNIGENKHFVKNGINGYICSTHKDFKEKLLIINQTTHQQYKELSENALKEFESFSIKTYCNRLVFALTNKNVFVKY